MNRVKNYLFATTGVVLLMLVGPPVSSDSKANDHVKLLAREVKKLDCKARQQ